MTRTLLFAGTGGAGTSSISAAAAVAAARAGQRVLLMSLASSDGLGDVLAGDAGQLAAGLPTPSGGVLHRYDVAGQALAERAWPAAAPVLAALLKVRPSELPVAEELPSLPAVQDLLVMLALHDTLCADDHDLVVIDAGTLDRALSLLSLPGTVSWLVRRFFPIHRRIARALRPVTPRIAGIPATAVFAGLDRVDASLTELGSRLADPVTGSTRLIVGAQSASLAQARRALPAFALYGHRVHEVVINKVWPQAPAGAMADCRQDEQDRIMAWQAAVAPVPVVQVEHGFTEPQGLAALTDLGQRIWPAASPVISSGDDLPDSDPGTIVVGRQDDGFELVLSLPAVAREEVSLARREDDLVVTVGMHRRQIDLPPALRRCVVSGAALEDGKLTVAFQPDPALWMTG